jgi:hypothetical protein
MHEVSEHDARGWRSLQATRRTDCGVDFAVPATGKKLGCRKSPREGNC